DAAAKAQYRHYAEALESDLATLQTRASSNAELNLVQNLRIAYGQVKAQADRIMEGLAIENIEERRRIFDTDLELNAFNQYEAAFDAIDRLLASNRAELAARLSRLDQLAPLLLMVPLVLAVGLLFLSRNFLQGSVIRPLNQLLHATKAIARGDLTQPVPQTGAAELAALSSAFNQMASDLATSRDMLVQAEKNATLSALVPVVAHNIRNPLSSIRATAQVLDDPELSGEVREGLRGIINTADRLEEWTRSLLSYLHPLEPQLTRCTFTQIADSALKLLQTKLDAKDITVVREHWEHAPEQALDVDLFEQALFGLIGNAIDASPRGGKLKLALATGAEHAKLTLGDQGSG
ncbi:MAG: HAMP domain-containing protein, partial [Burkholderiales bacterium]